MNNRIFNILLFVSLLLCGTTSANAGDINTASDLWVRANEAYQKNDFNGAIKLYNDVSAAGFDGEKLYFNLANAYYRDGNLGKAIVNYKRAERLDPQDGDVKHNLEIASLQTKNIIEPLPEFIMYTWFKTMRSYYSSNQWSGVSIVSFVLIFIFILAYLLSTTVLMRKISFTLATLSLLLFIFTTSFAVHQKWSVIDSDAAVILVGSTAVKSSPDTNGKDIFIINEGALVEVLDSVGDWSKIVVVSGNEGWLLTESIEVI